MIPRFALGVLEGIDEPRVWPNEIGRRVSQPQEREVHEFVPEVHVREQAAVSVSSILVEDEPHRLPAEATFRPPRRLGTKALAGTAVPRHFGRIDPDQPDPFMVAAVPDSNGVPIGDADHLGEFFVGSVSARGARQEDHSR